VEPGPFATGEGSWSWGNSSPAEAAPVSRLRQRRLEPVVAVPVARRSVQTARIGALATKRQERALEVVDLLRRMYPRARISLEYTTPFQLLIATILAAQSTDARVNIVTKSLFRKYPDAQSFAAASQTEMERDVKQTGFYRNKAKAVIAASLAIVENHKGEVPRTMEELTALPGVGRKTANVVLSNAFRKPAGIVVDTHVSRVAGRLGFTAESIPEKIEQDLMKLIPQKEWTGFAHRVIYHGREICVARKPRCSECRLNELCPSAETPLE
jgi:endonuclease-3